MHRVPRISQREVTRTIGTRVNTGGEKADEILSSAATIQLKERCCATDLQKVPGVDDLLGDYAGARFGEGGPW